MRRAATALACCLVLAAGFEVRAERAEEAVEAAPALEPGAASESESGEPADGEGDPSSLLEDSAVSADVRLAREHFRQGVRLVEQEHWGPALAEFEESYRLHPSGSAALNRALCLHRLRRYREALRAFQDYSGSYGAEASDQIRSGIRQTIDEIRSLVTEVDVRVSHNGARIVVDGVAVGTSPLAEPLLLQSGEHDIAVELEGFLRQEQTVMVVFGRPQPVQFNLEPRPRMGMLRVVSTTPGATLFIDGHDVGAPPYSGEVRADTHTVELRAPGFRTASVEVTVQADGDHLESIDLRRRLHRGWFYSTIGLAGAGLLTFAGLGSAVLVYDARYDETAENASEWYDDGHRLMVAADIALGVAAGLAVVALVLALFTEWNPPQLRADNEDDESDSAWLDAALPATF